MGDRHAFRALRAAVLVLSDKGARGEREDASGPALVKFLQGTNCEPVVLELLPDDRSRIAERLAA